MKWRDVQAALEARVGVGVSLSPTVMLLPLTLVTGLAFAIVAWSASRPDSAARLWFALLVQAVMLLNVAVHLVAAVAVMRGYSPGLLTAVVINLPFSLWIFTRAVRERWVNQHALLALIPAALLLHGPLLLLFLKIAGVATSSTACMLP